MVDLDLRSSVSDALAPDPATFGERAPEEAETVLAAVDDGSFDNPQGLIGLEHEFYAVAEYTKPYAPGEAFDLLIHVPETTASRTP